MKARQVKSKTTSIEELAYILHNAFQIEYSCLYFLKTHAHSNVSDYMKMNNGITSNLDARTVRTTH